ncbi:MAG TPA: hypothetical protein VF690_16770 [Hymenobacter sp.]|jgi:hypothetical protein
MADDHRPFDWNRVGVQEVPFANLSEITRQGLAGTIKRELEGRLRIQTGSVEEWAEALVLDNPLCVIDHAQHRFDIGPDQDYAEHLALQYLLILPEHGPTGEEVFRA